MKINKRRWISLGRLGPKRIVARTIFLIFLCLVVVALSGCADKGVIDKAVIDEEVTADLSSFALTEDDVPDVPREFELSDESHETLPYYSSVFPDIVILERYIVEFETVPYPGWPAVMAVGDIKCTLRKYESASDAQKEFEAEKEEQGWYKKIVIENIGDEAYGQVSPDNPSESDSAMYQIDFRFKNVIASIYYRGVLPRSLWI